jgi:phage tail-like protein
MADDLTQIRRYSARQYDPLRNFKFIVEFLPPSNGVSSVTPTSFTGGFTQVQGLGINTQNIQYREGGFNTTVHNLPGMTSYNPIVLNRGMVYGQDQAILWMKELFSATSGTGGNLPAGKDFRLDLKIYVNDHPTETLAGNGQGVGGGTPRVLFTVHNAWITGLSYTDLNGTDNNVLFEQMTLVHEGLSVDFVDSSGKPTTTYN